MASCSPERPVDETVHEELYISLTNNIAQSRKDEPIVITREKLEGLTKSFPPGQIPRLIGENGEEVPLQTDDMDGDGEWDEISFTYSMLPVYTAILKVETVAMALSADYDKKTNIVVYHQKRDQASLFSEAGNPPQSQGSISGIAWENDRMAFMIDFYPEPVKLILGKRTDKMILNKINFDSKSLIKQPWGRRLFNRIDSVGPGTLTFLEDSIINKIENYDSLKYQIITQGPVRSVFKINYMGVQGGAEKFNLEEQITIWGNQNGYKNKVSVSGLENNVTLAAAVPFYSPNSLVRNDEGARFYSVATYNLKDEDVTALGILLPKAKVVYLSGDTTKLGLDSNLYFIKFNINNQEPVNLHVYAGWRHQDERFNDPEGIVTLLDKEANRLNNPIEISDNNIDGE